MPVLTACLLILGSIAPLPGGGPDRGQPVEKAPSLVRRDLATIGMPATIRAMPPRSEWPWRISEADSDVEDTDDESDHLAPSARTLGSGFAPQPAGKAAPIRRETGTFRTLARSPILRC